MAQAAIIAVAQQKGGSGKTTLAAQLAVALRHQRNRVALVDIDPQGSLAGWAGLREARALPEANALTFVATGGWRLGNALAEVRGGHDLVLLDTPPHAEMEARGAVRAADLVLVPCQPSLLDVWALKPTLEAATQERRPIAVVLTRVPPRARVVDEVRSQLAEMELPVCDASIGNRTAFVTSMGSGLGVVESQPRSTAAAEIIELARETVRRIDALAS